MTDARHIIVDGWNAVRYNRGMERIFLESGLDAAREALWKVVEPIHDYGGVRVTIVYDGKGEEISIMRRNGIRTLSEVFTPSFMTADELIEQLCATSLNPSGITVVTRDNLLRLTATTFGAMALAPDKLFDSANCFARELSNSLKLSNLREERKWKSETPFAELDSLDLQIDKAVRKAQILSKHMKKRKKRLEMKGIAQAADTQKAVVQKSEIRPRAKVFSSKLKSFEAIEKPVKKAISERKKKAVNIIAHKPFSLADELKKPLSLTEIAAAKVLEERLDSLPKKKRRRNR